MLRTRKRMLLVAPEPSYGVGADIADAKLLLTTEVDSNPYEGDRVTRERQKQTFGAQPEINVAPYTTVTTTIPLSGSGTAGTPPIFGMLLRACGLAELIVASESVTYLPATEEGESFCVWFVEDGQVQKVPGVRGTVEANFTAKQDPTLQFTLTGLYKRPEQLAEAINKQPEAFAEEVVVNKQNTPGRNVHGYQGCLQSLSLNLGNEVVARNLPGCENVLITDRNVTGQVEIEAPNIATKNYFQAIESHQGVTKDQVSIKHGTTPGNIVEVVGTKVQLSTISRNDASGILNYTMGTRYIEDQSDDEVAMIFT